MTPVTADLSGFQSNFSYWVLECGSVWISTTVPLPLCEVWFKTEWRWVDILYTWLGNPIESVVRDFVRCRNKLKKLLKVKGHLPQCPKAGNTNSSIPVKRMIGCSVGRIVSSPGSRRSMSRFHSTPVKHRVTRRPGSVVGVVLSVRNPGRQRMIDWYWTGGRSGRTACYTQVIR